MKKILFAILLSLSFSTGFAAHITGGEMIYKYLGVGSGSNTSSYEITLKLFRFRNTTGAPMPPNVTIGVFNNSNNSLLTSFNATKTGEFAVAVDTPACIEGMPDVTYDVGIYTFNVELVNNAAGYTISYQTCCRINLLVNVFTQSGGTVQGEGSTYNCVIPGTNRLPVGTNNSPQFSTLVSPICAGNSFSFDFSASDPDGDSLVYFFCNAYNRGNSTSAQNVTPSAPPYQSVQYINGFTANSPLGSTATLNSKTGIISGIAPITRGNYVVCVCILEYRDGVLIGSHRKDIIINVADCNIPKAILDPKPTTCDGFLVNFSNDNPSTAGINTYLWIFGDPSSGLNDTAFTATPSHDYSASGAGDYLVKLFINKGLACEDSAKVTIKVYPGFRPAFEVLGQCKNTPIQFNDLSQHDFGTIFKWTWNFDDPSSGVNNTSTLKNPTHIFAASGTYNVTLLVESDKGCSATIPKQVEVKDKPAFTVFPKDTLICTIDDLQIGVTGSGTVVWSPNYNINNVNSPTPIVSPDVTTTYVATFTDAFGCSGTDDVKINVVDKVTQGNNYDTTVCTGDPAVLRLFSNALYYSWTPNDGSLNSTTIKNPTAKPTVTTDYVVVGKISNICFAQNTIRVKPVLYPNVVAPDVSICFGKNAQLNASGGSIYNWSPRNFLTNTTIHNPQAINPTSSVLYTLTVRDVLGCPKPAQKIVKLNVVKIKANAGPRDTSVVLGQPLQLTASGGTDYLWLPDNRWLNRIDIYNPIALPQTNIEYIVQVSDANGCFAFDSIRVKLYTVKPGLYVPNAFTPNGDNINDYFRPIALGIKSLDKFEVYNRWGQLVYSNTDLERGWDGTFGGRPQDPAGFVWIAEATDYAGKKVKLKGTVVLIRQ
jgi:gliding motility-associated-like protein